MVHIKSIHMTHLLVQFQCGRKLFNFAARHLHRSRDEWVLHHSLMVRKRGFSKLFCKRLNGSPCLARGCVLLHVHDVCRYPLEMIIVLQKVSHIRNAIYGMLASNISRDDSANKRIQVKIVNGLRAVPHQIVIRIQKLRSGTK